MGRTLNRTTRANTTLPMTAPSETIMTPSGTSTPPHSTKPQFFLSFALIGSIVPFLPVLLEERGLSKPQIGLVIAVSYLGILLTPLLITALADTRVAGRWLMTILFALAGLFAAALLPAHGFWAVMLLYGLHSLALQPIFPLQDGIHFAVQAQRMRMRLPEIGYHTVRLFGTFGYIVPGFILYFFLRPGGSMDPTLWCGVIVAAIGTAYAIFRLPHTPPAGPSARLPTADAARAMRNPHVLVFCIAMFLVHVASTAYYIGYPLHLTSVCGIDKRWVGLIANIGVACEVGFVLGFAWLVKRYTLRRVMYIGALAISVRMFLLAASDSIGIAIAIQLIHGPTVLAVHIAPPSFLNSRADDRYRNSIQGLYSIAFAGTGRIAGSLLAGWLAKFSLATMFTIAAAICLVGVALFFYAFGEREHGGEKNGIMSDTSNGLLPRN